jgi:hypothetical protein
MGEGKLTNRRGCNIVPCDVAKISILCITGKGMSSSNERHTHFRECSIVRNVAVKFKSFR